MTNDQLHIEFIDRYIAHINKGTLAPLHQSYIIPLTQHEVNDLKDSLLRKEKWKHFEQTELVGIADMFEVDKSILDEIARKELMLVGKYYNACYYPPFDGFVDRKNNIVPFEDTRVAWNFYLKKLSNNTKFTKLLFVKISV